jgi:hypothetical protein
MLTAFRVLAKARLKSSGKRIDKRFRSAYIDRADVPR